MRIEDAQLVARCLAGDTDAYADLVNQYQSAVFATAFYYVGRYGAAEDVSQESFMAAYRSLQKLKQPESFGPWLKEITCRTAANWLRRHGVRLKNETPLPFRRTLSIEDARAGPRGQVEKKEVFERVQQAIDTLPERYRLTVVLRYLQELSYDEIVSFTGDSREEVRSALQRGSKQLREVLSDLDSSSEGESRWQPALK